MEITLQLDEIIEDAFLSSNWLAGLLAWTFALVMYGSLPAILYSVFSRNINLSFKLGVSCLFFVLILFIALVRANYIINLLYLTGGLIYFYIVSCGIHWFANNSSCLRLTRSTIISLCALFNLLLPCLILPTAEANQIRLFGFEMMLSSYSYIVEISKGRKRSSKSEALFFLLVNPTIVLHESGAKICKEKFDLRAVARLLVGAVTLAASVFIAESYSILLDTDFLARLPNYLFSANRFIAEFIALLTTTYFIHSGSASVQIAWMQLLGWQIPERYNWPIFATSPMAFWRRWNIYIGSWLKRYIFTTTTLYWRRTYRNIPPLVTQGGTLIGTFVVCGFLHDFGKYVANFNLSIASTLAFFISGLIVLCELAFIIGATKIINTFSIVVPSSTRKIMIVIGFFLNLVHLAAMGWVMTTDSSGRLNDTLGALLGLDKLGF